MTRPPTIEEILDYCLANPEGLSTQQLLDKFPEHSERLQYLLAVAAGIPDLVASVPSVPPDRKVAMRQRLMAAAEAAEASRATRPNLVLLNGNADHAPEGSISSQQPAITNEDTPPVPGLRTIQAGRSVPTARRPALTFKRVV